MKRLICLLTIALIICTAFSACGKSYPEPDMSTLTEAAVSSQPQSIDFSDADGDTVNAVFECDVSLYDDFCVMYSSDPASADIIAIFKSSDEKMHAEAQKMLNDFLSQRIDDFKGYAPLEVKKMEDCRVVSYGKYDILMILPDFSSANEAVGKVFSE